MSKDKKLTRRNFTVLSSIAAVGLTSDVKSAQDVSFEEIVYKPADPSRVADYAYKIYPDGACMYAMVKSVLSMTNAKPHSIPYDMFKYGRGGCGGQGSICGTCNGAAAAIGYYIHDKKDCDALIANVFKWYETAELPAYTPAGAKESVSAVSGSTLCHISMTKWCQAAGKGPFSDERKMRCRLITADTAAKTVELLNDYFSGSLIKKKNVLSSEKNSCAPCHTVKTESVSLSKVPKASVKMDCGACHSDAHPDGIKLPKSD